MCTLLEILSGNSPEYDSDDINYYTPSLMCCRAGGEAPIEKAPRLTPPNQSPHCPTSYLRGKGGLPVGSVGGPRSHQGRARAQRRRLMRQQAMRPSVMMTRPTHESCELSNGGDGGRGDGGIQLVKPHEGARCHPAATAAQWTPPSRCLDPQKGPT